MARKRPLYAVLGVAPDAADGDISRAYRRLALQYHPDRNPDGEVRFKEIASAYDVLGDAERRRVYDATGLVPGAAAEESEETAAQRSAEMRERVRAFYATYAGSTEETDDALACYAKCQGNFRRMLRAELLFDNGNDGEIARLHGLVQRLVESGRVAPTEAWRATSTAAALKKIRRAMAQERREAADALESMGLSHSNDDNDGRGGVQGLQALIRRDQEAAWGGMLRSLEEKYLKPKAAARKRAAAPHDGEEQKARKKVRR